MKTPSPSSAYQRGDRLRGVFARHRSGAGYARLISDSGEPLLGKDGSFFEVCIPRVMVGSAVPGDIVEIELIQDEELPWQRDLPRGKREERFVSLRGKVVEILQRKRTRFVGTLHRQGRYASVAVDAELFERDINIEDAHALGAANGDKVVIEMTLFPDSRRIGEGVVVERLGRTGDPQLEESLVIRQYQLSETFSDEVQTQARRQTERIENLSLLDETVDDSSLSLQECFPFLSGRTDLRSETIVTIDPEDARDFDDAVSLTRTETNGYRLGVHIADVSFFVPPGTPLDQEARRRGTSVYLPRRVVPMLPETISNAAASLQPGKVRLTKSVFMEFSPRGVLTDVRLVRSFIQSAKRLTYDEADAFLADPASYKESYPIEIRRLLNRMNRLATILHRRRMNRGAIEMNFAEIRFQFNSRGKLSGIKRQKSTPARRLIEEFMLVANQSVAIFLKERSVPFLRRVHPAPSLRKLERFVSFVQSLGFGKGSKTSRSVDRFLIQSLLEQTIGTPEEESLQFALLRSLPKAVYAPIPEGHFALALKDYTHFTSPIRRYCDLSIHQLLDRILTGEKSFSSPESLTLLGYHLSDQERAAESAEREAKRLILLQYLKRYAGKTMRGVVTRVERHGFYVEGRKIPAEGFIPLSSIHSSRYEYDRQRQILTGRRKKNIIRAGQEVLVRIDRSDPDARSLDLSLVERKTERKSSDNSSFPRRKSSAAKKKHDVHCVSKKKSKRKRKKSH